MPSPKGSERNFYTVASKYEKMRSGYVDELYQEKFDYDIKYINNILWCFRTFLGLLLNALEKRN